jgi:hypothetical protein
MDHSNAILMELNNDTIVQNIIVSEPTYVDKEYSFHKHEKLVNKKEQYSQAAYLKEIGGIIKNYTEVLLFGPTEAKNELLNLLKKDHLFENIKIDVLNSDKMTENQMHVFVREYFNSPVPHN